MLPSARLADFLEVAKTRGKSWVYQIRFRITVGVVIPREEFWQYAIGVKVG